MKQELIKKEISHRGFSSRSKENRIISEANKFIKEINEDGGEVVKYTIDIHERRGINVSVTFLVNW